MSTAKLGSLESGTKFRHDSHRYEVVLDRIDTVALGPQSCPKVLVIRDGAQRPVLLPALLRVKMEA